MIRGQRVLYRGSPFVFHRGLLGLGVATGPTDPNARLDNGAFFINPATGAQISYVVTGPDGIPVAHYADNTTVVVSPLPSSPTPTPPAAVTASGQVVSTQTGTPATTPLPVASAPPPALVTTPAAGSQPTSTVSPSVTPVPPPPGIVPSVPAVSPSGAVISSTSGAPAPAPASPSSSIMDWLTGSMFGGIPNWLLVGGAALLFFGESGGSRRR